MHQELGGVKGIVDEVLALATVGVDDGILNLVASESLQAQSCLRALTVLDQDFPRGTDGRGCSRTA